MRTRILGARLEFVPSPIVLSWMLSIAANDIMIAMIMSEEKKWRQEFNAYQYYWALISADFLPEQQLASHLMPKTIQPL